MLQSLWREVLAAAPFKFQAFRHVRAVFFGSKDSSLFNFSVTQPKNCCLEDQGTTVLANSRTFCITAYQNTCIFNPRWCSTVNGRANKIYTYLTANRVNLWELFCLCNADVLYFGLSQHPQDKQWGSKQKIHALGSFLSNSCIAVQLQSNTSDRRIYGTWRWRQILWNFRL